MARRYSDNGEMIQEVQCGIGGPKLRYKYSVSEDYNKLGKNITWTIGEIAKIVKCIIIGLVLVADSC